MNGVLTPDEVAAYKKGWAQPGMLTGGLGYYRANLAAGPVPTKLPADKPVTVPALLMWETRISIYSATR